MSRGALKSPWLAAPVVGLTVWVNWPTLRGFYEGVTGGGTETTQSAVTPEGSLAAVGADGPVQDEQKPRAGVPTTASRGGFSPIEPRDDVADPFAHALSKAAATAGTGPAGNEEQRETEQAKEPPVPLRVSLVLRSAGSQRAVVGGKVVGVGDVVDTAHVVAIATTGVRFRLADGREVFVALRAAPKPSSERAGESEPRDRRDSSNETRRDTAAPPPGGGR